MPEAYGFAIGRAARCDDDGNDDKTQEASDFNGTCYDLGLTKPAHAHQIDCKEQDETDCDDHGRG